MAIHLYPYQEEAIRKMKNGCILNGDVGTGKTITSIAYYFFKNGGIWSDGHYIPMPMDGLEDLYIITTAQKRDTGEWEKDMMHFLLSPNPDSNYYKNTVVIDSWNNIKKYDSVRGAFFIFDEDKVTGNGAWVKSFYKIAKNNEWIILSATPGDKWIDYVPVFVANGFYKNKTDFCNQHVYWDRYKKYPCIKDYFREAKLNALRRSILVDMKLNRKTVPHHIDIWTKYQAEEYKRLFKLRWNEEKQQPIESAAELSYHARKICNADPSRLNAVLELLEKHPTAIIFYNFDYELFALRELLDKAGIYYQEWNGHVHQRVPEGQRWVYLVNYGSSEGWNCVTTNAIIFYSQNYSYRITKQASGRIDRVNTEFHDLYYYHLKSRSPIDIAISKALKEKKNFNESAYFDKLWEK